MIRLRRLILLVAALLAVGAAVTTGAFSGGDQAVRGVYLTPADTTNGDRYASIGDDGQIELSITDLNTDSTNVFEDVFVIGTDLEQAQVWIEDDSDAVDFYRTDTGASVEDPDDPVALRDGESIPVGLEIETSTERVVLESITVRAQVPDRRTGSGTGSTDPDDTPTPSPTRTDEDRDTPTDRDTPAETDTPTETATETPVENRTDTPADGGTATPTPTTTRTPAGGGGAPGNGSAPALRIVDLTAEPANPTVGQSVTITAIVENTGTETGTDTFEIRAGGDVIATETVTLAPGERRTISGTVTFDQAGAHEVALGDRSITVSVSEPSRSPLEIGGFPAVVLLVLAALAAALPLLVLWRSRDTGFVVLADDVSWSRLELTTESAAATAETDGDGRTVLRFEVADGTDPVVFDPAFAVRNAVAESVGLRMVPLDEDGNTVTDDVSVQDASGTDLTRFPTSDDDPHALSGSESLQVRIALDDPDATALRTLRVETTTDV
jgi:hypothetical protein